eukprot:9402138-Ditylum_brightwellii.AAC.1
MLSSVSLFEDTKERGMGTTKRKWVIEMNEGYHLYLNMYYKVDVIDHLIKKMHMGYQCCKY